MGNAVMKGLHFADTQELCFEAWKHSYIASSALLCGQLAYSQKSRFLALKRSYTCSAALEGGRSSFINEFCFQKQNLQTWTMSKCKGFYLLIETSKR